MQIGSLKLENNVFLAPMAGITDRPFRTLCHEMGSGLVYSEMVSAKGIYYNNEKKIKEAYNITEYLNDVNTTQLFDRILSYYTKK